ncbi:type I glutamate--ammonia ligase [Gulosibacter molinativorax]|uniref:Glutamine synthetase n=1 Tax=Gulosibacter molinativorax TaxID=256821 RepID=A0ABT7C8T5_9MICO|nr:glutamine synthetase family protein [Gulosibacter molinativorax]MDJ1371567.1 glutamine synthetase [Gulosibacter molinativorax]QUY61090.1 Glutamate--ammonia ligase, catalytic domain protein [Gulosibacter molinativorax]
MNERPDELIFLATTDISARTKGRAVPAEDFRDDTTVGWVPANLGIGSLGHIVDDIPYGSSGDLRLKPDLDARYRIDGVPGRTPLNIVFSDIINTDGTPWESCSRNFLREAIADLGRHGLEMSAAFEHEFVDLSATTEPHPFSLQSFRAADPIGAELVTILRRAGLEPENWLPEYAEHQYEITVKPSDPMRAADRAILVRDVVYDLYQAHGRHASFSPVVRPGAGGSGVHVHMGITHDDGSPALWDAAAPGRVSELGAKFAAGIVKYAPEFTALFAPLVTSYDRLAPHNWSTARAFFGLQNREALLRICPTNELNGRDPSKQLHFEFRGSDIGANPWLLLGVLIRAGLAGIDEDLEPAEVIEGELDLDGKHRDLKRLPESLEGALDALEASDAIRRWFVPNWITTFLAVKREEVAQLRDKTPAEVCEVYANVY